MKKIFLVHGLQRSGNHAIINWIRKQDRFVFFDNVIPITPILTGQNQIPAPLNYSKWLRKNLTQRKLPLYNYLKQIMLMRHSLLVSLEDHPLTLRPFKNTPYPISNILILRSPSNLFASRIRRASSEKVRNKLGKDLVYPSKMGVAMERVIDLWKLYANECLGNTNFLENKTCIYFDAWFANQDYRKNISQKLGISFTDYGFSKVPKAGGGSSFDKRRFTGENIKMDVLNRANHLTDAEQKVLEQVISDQELRELNNKITQKYARFLGEN